MSEKRHYFEDLADRWDSIPAWPDAARKVDAYCRRACSDSPRYVLDVGAGTGVLVPSLLGLVPDNAIVVELDFAHRMLTAGRQKLADPRVRHVCGDALATPFADGLFDVVLCFGILPHLGCARGALTSLWPVVRPGGTLAVGHLTGSVALNERHSEIGGPVAHDLLPPADDVAAIFDRLGASQIDAEDSAEGYFVRARKAVE